MEEKLTGLKMLRGYFGFELSSVFNIKLIPRYFVKQPRDNRRSMRALIFFEDVVESMSSVLLILI